MGNLRVVRVFGLLAVLVVAGCDCGDGNLNPVPDQDAGVSGRCTTNDDCATGEVCTAGACVSLDQCGPDQPCPDPEQTCIDGDRGYRICVYTRCESDDECQTLTCDPDLVPACVGGGCQCGVPCQGGCPFGQGCCIPTDTCQDLPAECMDLTCPPGQFVSVTSTGAWSAQACEVLGETCQCERLPPLPEGDIGLYSALEHDGQGYVMTAYNLTYGDLMFGVVQGDGQVAWEFVDGVPTSTTPDDITGDIDGPRRGNGAPGPDVGLYTDVVAAADGTPHVVYQDRDQGALKYARLTPQGWQTHTVDGANIGDTGRYAAVALDAQERPVVAYLSYKEDVGGRRVSTLRLAVATSATPGAPGDWGRRDLETLDLTGLSCAERCNVNEVCLRSTDRCVVPDDEQACSPRCEAREACVNATCEPVRSLPTFMGLPRARGLWPSAALLPDGGLLVAYHDRVDMSLKVARISGPDLLQGALTITTIEGTGGPTGAGEETGLYPSLVVTPGGEIHLAYVNATRQTLRYRNLNAQLATVVVEDVESGLGQGSGPDGELIGADAALVVDGSGRVRVAYQNATLGDLRYARRDGADTWTLITLAGDEPTYQGTYGFYTDQVLNRQGTEPMVSTYRYFLSAEQGPRNGVSVFSPP
ncbi:MAG: hypothetical protein KC933_12850 [Myxococcales bacterium]|nr:hypothetical protein [Myxococcales bacterium]MCB9646713.1 hypothetical protein [Deltaproteobacteria bacterium]